MPEVRRYNIDVTPGRPVDMVENRQYGRYVLYTDAVKMQREAFVAGGKFYRVRFRSGGYSFLDDSRLWGDCEAEATRRYKEEP